MILFLPYKTSHVVMSWPSSRSIYCNYNFVFHFARKNHKSNLPDSSEVVERSRESNWKQQDDKRTEWEMNGIAEKKRQTQNGFFEHQTIEGGEKIS